MSFGTKILTTAFVTGQAELRPKDIDLRNESLAIRSELKGKSIPVMIYNQHVYDIAEPLLKVTSVYATDFVKNGAISLPNETSLGSIDSRCVGILLNYMASLTKVNKVPMLQLRDNGADMLSLLGVCQAAKALGMDKYVDHIIRRVDAIFHDLPSYEDLDTLIANKDSYPRVYAIAVRNFARKTRQGEIPDQKDFDEYLKTRSDFAHDIEETLIKHDNWVEAQAKYEQRKQHRVKVEEQAKIKAIGHKKQEKERLAHEKQFWDAKKANDTKMRKSTEAKLRASGNARKFTPEERT